MNATCDYHGCIQPLAGQQPDEGAKLCQQHAAEFHALAESGKVKDLVEWWAEMRGGWDRVIEESLANLPDFLKGPTP